MLVISAAAAPAIWERGENASTFTLPSRRHHRRSTAAPARTGKMKEREGGEDEREKETG